MNKISLIIALILPLTGCIGVGIGTGGVSIGTGFGGVGVSANLPTQSPKASQTVINQVAPQAPLVIAPKSNATKVARPSDERAEQINQALALTNQLRANKGLPALRLDPNLTAYAQARAGELPTHFSHNRPSGQLYHTVLTRGHNGENIAAGSSSAQATVMGQWKNSKGHYANMVNPNFTKIGIGAVYAPSSKFGYYWVQVFGDDGTTAPFVF